MKPNQGILKLFNPANPSHCTGTYRWNLEDAEASVRRAHRAFPAWSRPGLNRRWALLKKFKRVLARRKREIASVISLETGKVFWEAKEEVELCINKFDQTLIAARELLDTPATPDPHLQVLYRPYGVVLVLGPFNFPLHLSHGHILPALFAGNTVVFKPSDKTCGAGRIYGRCAEEAGLPAGVFNVVQGAAAVGEFLAIHPLVRVVLFTGSQNVGQRLQAITLNRPDKLLALEMGGKNAAVVFRAADLKAAAAECVRGAYVTTGQRCTSTSRIFVEAGVFERFCEEFVSNASPLKVGDPFGAGIFCGPVISNEACDRALKAIRTARRLGGSPILEEGRTEAGRGHFLRLSAHRFARYPGRNWYTTQELFVPEVGIYPFKDLEEAVSYVEDTNYGLALSIFSRDRKKFNKIVQLTTHGVTNWNIGTTGASAKLPFGGCKQSGNARPAGAFAIRNCLYPVAIRTRA